MRLRFAAVVLLALIAAPSTASAQSRDADREAVRLAALDYVEDGMTVGVGTGSTVNKFIDALASIKASIPGAVSCPSRCALTALGPSLSIGHL